MAISRIVRIVEMGPKWTARGKDWGYKGAMVGEYTAAELGELLFNMRQHSMLEHGVPCHVTVTFPDGQEPGDFPTA